MMNLLLTSILLLSSISSISCQSIHFCQALKDNNWKIDYSLNVPNGTFSRKFIIIKQNYWELEYNPMSNRRKRQDIDMKTPFIKGPVSLKNVWSKQTDWLAGDYQLAFAVRNGNPSQSDWAKTVLALTKTQIFDWSLFDRNFGDLKEGSKKQSTATNFGGFKPQVSYTMFSRQEQNSIVFIEQLFTGKDSPKFISIIQAYNTTDASKGFENETNDPGLGSEVNRKIPEAINITSMFYKIKGMFGVQTEFNKTLKNSTIYLIEYCGPSFKMGPGGQPICNATITYNYCIADESDENPIQELTKCHPAGVDKHQLADCSNPEVWKATTVVPDLPISAQSVYESNSDANSTKSEPIATTEVPSEAASEDKSSGFLWILIIIIVIIIIFIIVVVFLLCCRGKAKGGQPNEGEPQSSAPLASSMGSARSEDVRSKTGGPKDASKATSLSKKAPDKTKKGDSLAVPSVRSSIK